MHQLNYNPRGQKVTRCECEMVHLETRQVWHLTGIVNNKRKVMVINKRQYGDGDLQI